ncbi:ATP-binding cassette domain-containing protein [Paenibacillus brevis]|uniref:ATP-binding cassette domain-containing protein n=1 Tax=Paenibacillus brevis TaxID=2841508 RepID=A0ABS6FNR6_9BACL|nr:ATP-binding cassette domain-containing protein [Paenibacillus brevis]MBU5671132.1 ATP-binding cassette domain-containing protein [Paenibacillus brevis]
MNQAVLKTSQLTKIYQGVTVLHNVSVTLEAGKIYGLIGQNGAGKTTLMRLISGLAFPSGGSLELFGRQGEQALQAERKRVGCMIEYPGIVGHMSARENLRLHRLMKGIPNPEIEEELLRLVGLADTDKKKAKNFSLGMKQRLGIAIALIGNPELLILDEPINGLDPLGVVEIRNLLKQLSEERMITILISSHNLPELYQTATDYLFIHQGQLREALTLAQLDERCRQHIRIECDQPDKLVSLLESELGTQNVQVLPDKTIKLYDYYDDREQVSRLMFDHGIRVMALSNEGDTLEDYYISLIGGGKHD